MKAVLTQFAWLAVVVSSAMAQSAPATLRDVKVAHTEKGIQVDVSLSNPVQPVVQVAHSPERLVLDFPNTTASSKQERIEVNQNGIRAIRYGLNSSNPAITRVVIDLDSTHPYEVRSNGTTVALTIGRSASAQVRHIVPPAAASGGFIDIFRRHGTSSPHVSDPDKELKRPLPWVKSESTTARNTTPSAAHPNMGSLQQGTVYPAMGSPGAGTVPVNSATGSPTTSQNVTALVVSAPKPSIVVQPPANVPTQVVTPAPEIKSLPTASKHNIPLLEVVVVPPVAAEQKETATQISTPASIPDTQQKETAAIQPVQTETPATSTSASATVEAANQQETSVVLDPNLKTVFRVKYVADGVAYLDGGRSSGLAEGMKLEIKDGDTFKQGMTTDPSDPRVVAELQVTGLADSSAVTDIHMPHRPVKVGDLAYLSTGDAQAIIAQKTMSPTRSYPMVLAFSEGDPMDEEVRKELPRPPMPSVNRARGRIGFDYMGTISHDNPGSTNTDLGMIVRTDVTRIGGSYWNLSGYWRGRLHSRSAASQPTLQDLINRTYHLGMFYDNPESRLVAGVGRLYLPWAPSLDTIDGGPEVLV